MLVCPQRYVRRYHGWALPVRVWAITGADSAAAAVSCRKSLRVLSMSGQAGLFDRHPGAAQVRQLHLRILAREQDAIRAGPQSCRHRGPGAFGAGFALRLPGRNVDVDSRPQLRLRPVERLSLIHISEPTRLGMISY